MRYPSLFAIALVCLLKADHGLGQGTPIVVGGPISTCEYVRSRGFGCEMHKIVSGNCPLTLYRIINPLANPLTLNKYPVLYGHGLLYDSQSMISRSENSRPRKPTIGIATVKYPNFEDFSDDHSLPFMFSNNNFDVFLFDMRGVNLNNRNLSTDLNPVEMAKFWDFCLDDQALTDLPNLIEYVLKITASSKLVYVGYSETTLFMFALLSSRPEMAQKLVAYVALAPVAYVANVEGFALSAIAPVGLIPDSLAYGYPPQAMLDAFDSTLRNLCRFEGVSDLICGSVTRGIGGQGRSESGPELFRQFFKSTSIKALKHFLQLVLSKRFGMYDYGPLINVERYGQTKPPDYILGNIKFDGIILVRGTTDILSDPKDQVRLLDELGSKPFLDLNIEGYNHFDFIDGQELIKEANEPIMVAVYELMFKDGPMLTRTADQNQAIENLQQATVIQPHAVTQQQQQQQLSPVDYGNDPLTIKPMDLFTRVSPFFSYAQSILRSAMA